MLVVEFRLRAVHGWSPDCSSASDALHTIIRRVPRVVSKLWLTHDENEGPTAGNPRVGRRLGVRRGARGAAHS